MSSSMPWVKVYTDIIRDTKMRKLSERIRWRFIEMIVLAGECDTDGFLVDGDCIWTIDDIAWQLHADPAQLLADLNELIAAGMLCNEDGAYCVVNFTKRQGRSQKDKRAEWRARQAKKRSASNDGGTPPPPPEPDMPIDPDLSLTPPENVTRESRVTLRLDKSREEKSRDIAAKPANAPSGHNTSVSDATQPQAEAAPTVTQIPQTDRRGTGDALSNIMERALKVKANPGLATVGRWNLPPHLTGICEDYVSITGAVIKPSDKGLFLAGAKDIHDLFTASTKAYSRAWMEQAIKTANWSHAHPRALDKSFRELFKKGWTPAGTPDNEGLVTAGFRYNADGSVTQLVKAVAHV
jgi:hypothetical protein